MAKMNIFIALFVILPLTVAQSPDITTATSFPASLCGTPCVVTWSPLTTTLTLHPPAATISFEDAPSSITVSFGDVTTVTTIQLAPSTSPNSDPEGTPTLSFPLSFSLGSLVVSAQATITNNNEQVVLAVEEDLDLDAEGETDDEGDSSDSGSDSGSSDSGPESGGTDSDFGEIEYDPELDDDEDDNPARDNCEYTYANKTLAIVGGLDQPFDMLGCTDIQKDILMNAFGNALEVLQIANQMTAQSKGFAQFFQNANYFPTWLNFMNIAGKLWDANIDIADDPQKPDVRLVCIDKDTPFDPSVDATGNLLRLLVGKCNPADVENIGKLDIPNQDGGALAVTDNFDTELDDRCVPVIHLCPSFFDTLHFLADDVTMNDQGMPSGWCTGHNDGVTPNYNFIQNADIDYAALTPAQTIANDMANMKHFATFAITLLHEMTHIDQIGVLAGKAMGTGGREEYARSVCRTGMTQAEEEDNAESHALAVHEQFWRIECDMPLE